MKIFLIGRNGQLGSALLNRLKKAHQVFSTNRISMDLTNLVSSEKIIVEFKPDLIINAAAYTNVDLAEFENDLAFQINVLAPKFLSDITSKLNIPIVHFSSNYIFDGKKNEAYKEDDLPNPLSIYGKTKWYGDKYIQNNPKHIILRTSWLFSNHKNNFFKKIVDLSQEKESFHAVNDIWGSPTSVKTLVDSVALIISRLNHVHSPEIFGTYHITCQGKTNWYDYSLKILSLLEEKKIKTLLKKERVFPVSSGDYYKNVIRPMNATLSSKKYCSFFKIELPHWESEIDNTISEMF
jgi:dTDP-4-dehydrorhamnose reductase